MACRREIREVEEEVEGQIRARLAREESEVVGRRQGLLGKTGDGVRADEACCSRMAFLLARSKLAGWSARRMIFLTACRAPAESLGPSLSFARAALRL